MNLDGRIALVTGAAVRLGREIALSLADAGCDVAVHYSHSAAQAGETAADIRAKGRNAEVFAADLSTEGAAEALIEAVVARFGRLDVLVNSAAIMKKTPIGRVSYADWDSTMRLNLRGPFFLSQAAAKVMCRDGGAIVNMADLAAFETWSSYIPHSISKAGIVQMTRAMAHALGPTIRVNAIAPGVVLLPDGWPRDAAEKLRETTPLRKLGSPKDVTDALLYLLRSDFVTGETLVVDGGRNVRR